MTAMDILDLVYQALRQANDARINDVTLDGTDEDCEIILTSDDGKEKRDWVIRAKDITEAERGSP